MMNRLIERAHEALSGKVGRLILWSFLCAMIIELGTMIDPWYYGMPTSSMWIWFDIFTVIYVFAVYPVLIGYQWGILALVRQQSFQFKDVLLPFQRQYGRHVAAGLLIAVFQSGWTLLLVIPGIVKYFSYAFTYFVLRDNPHLSALEAITTSRRLMDGRKWDAFKLILPVVPVFLSGLTLYMWLDLPVLASWSFLITTALIRPLLTSRLAVFYEEARQQDDMTWNRSA